MSKLSRMIGDLLAGKEVDIREAGATWAETKHGLAKLGYRFDASKVGTRRLQDHNLDHTVEDVLKVIREIRNQHNRDRQDRLNYVEQLKAKRREQAKVMVDNGHSIEAMQQPSTLMGVPALDRALPLATPPALGAELQVFAMVLQGDGSLRIGLQNGQRRWIADVVGEMER